MVLKRRPQDQSGSMLEQWEVIWGLWPPPALPFSFLQWGLRSPGETPPSASWPAVKLSAATCCVMQTQRIPTSCGQTSARRCTRTRSLPVSYALSKQTGTMKWLGRAGAPREKSPERRFSQLVSESFLCGSTSWWVKKLYKQPRPHYCHYCWVYATFTPQRDTCRRALPTPRITHYLMNDLIG